MRYRLKAFLIHLCGSAILAVLAMLLVFGVWYPAPYDHITGVADIFLVVLFVDVVLGPLITLLIARRGKKGLLFDYIVIVFFQLIAFVYGLLVVAEGRPVWVVFNSDRFDIVRVREIDQRNLNQAAAEYRRASWWGPRWVSVLPPEDLATYNQLVLETAFAGVGMHLRPELYVPLLNRADKIRQEAKPLDDLKKYNNEQQLEAILAEWPAADAWLPIGTREKSMVALLRQDVPEVVAIVDLTPWPL
ncbi:type IV pilin accessory protein [Cellvibrio japonicus]|nr:type IV pilin accessory protein [Cellvibrio japonicus]QEI17814.1 type IV pilin accessory protein [Cellvibrio japonicus]QEI21389.1 type IV pilin accessory protein [Cellvibrio japonicus]